MRNFANNFNEEIKTCTNMQQVLVVINKYYQLDKPFGIATKLLVITGVKKILALIKAQEKQH